MWQALFVEALFWKRHYDCEMVINGYEDRRPKSAKRGRSTDDDPNALPLADGEQPREERTTAEADAEFTHRT